MSGAGARCGAACQKLARVNAQGAGKIAGRGRAAGHGGRGSKDPPGAHRRRVARALGWRQKREQDLVRRESPREGHACAHVESVRQSRPISPRAGEVAKRDPTRVECAHGWEREATGPRTNSGKRGRETIVDRERAEDEEPRLAEAKEVRDDVGVKRATGPSAPASTASGRR